MEMKRVFRYTKAQHDEAIKIDPIVTVWVKKANNRRPWEVSRFKRRNPLLLK